MKRKTKSSFFSILLILLVSSVIVYAGDRTKKYDYTGFSSVNVGYAMSLKVVQSNDYEISVTADERDLEYLEVDKSGDVLKFYFTKNNYRQHGDIEINISMPELRDLDLHGAANADITMDIGSQSFNADLSGASNVWGSLKCGNLDIDLSGSSYIDLSDFNVKDVDIDLSGSSKIKVSMDGELNAGLSGASSIVYYGKASLGNVSTSGASSIEKGR